MSTGTAAAAYEAVRRLVAQYSQLLDDHRVDEWVDLFTADVRFEVVWRDGGWVATGRDELRTRICEAMGIAEPGDGSVVHRGGNMHIGGQPVIEFDGDPALATSAQVWWDLISMRVGAAGFAVIATGRYHARAVAEADRWRFATRTSVHSGAGTAGAVPPTPSG